MSWYEHMLWNVREHNGGKIYLTLVIIMQVQRGNIE